MIEDLLTANDIEAEASAAGLSMAEVCRRAGIAQSTFARWKAGKTEPTLDVCRKLRDVVSPGPGAWPIPAAEATRGPGMAEQQTPLLIPARQSHFAPDIELAAAAEIFARLDRELAVAEARADRLLRRYQH